MTNLTENSAMNAVLYLPSEEDIRNPERGAALQVQYLALCSESGSQSVDGEASTSDNSCFEHQPITPEFLKEKLTGENKNVTLILSRYFFNEPGSTDTDAELPQRYLDTIENDFAVVRQAGLKMIMRFAYNRILADNQEPPYNDAPDLKTLQGHIQQVKPLLEANQDIIATIEAGWIGVWGEWDFSDIYGRPDENGLFTPEQYSLRRKVLMAILAATPSQRMVQLRTPNSKRKLLGEPSGTLDAVTLANAFDGSPISRTGHHNDCFLKDHNDEGTYLGDDDGRADREYVANDTQYTVNGGETCGRDLDLPVVTCDEALAALRKYHWSYLNFNIASDELGGDPITGVRPLIKGDFAPYLDDIRKVLGYRLVLLRSKMPSMAFQGEVLPLHLEIRNDGCAAPFNPRAVEVVLRRLDLSSAPEYSLPLPMDRTREGLSPNDPRGWLADGMVRLIDENLVLPADIPAGMYAVLLNLPDPSPAAPGGEALRKDPRYSIRLANEDLYEPDTGYNALKQTVMIAARES